jgi:LmbE family N-acetylglucosaminyl deacetylase
MPSDFFYYDLRKRIRGSDIELIFPNWQSREEVLVVLSPHDDDAVLGAGYVTLAALANGASVYVIIFCDGRAGYSSIRAKPHIVETRRTEAVAAYGLLGLDEGHLIRFDYPDFSVRNYLGWVLPDGREGIFPRSVRILRELNATRLLIANGYREHVDHSAVALVGMWDGPQAGDPVLVDWGSPQRVKTFFTYAVWGRLSSEDALVSRESDLDVRGNRLVSVNDDVEGKIRQSIKQFRSQARVIEAIIQVRKGRKVGDRFIEPYLEFDPRPSSCLSPYAERIGEIDEGVD